MSDYNAGRGDLFWSFIGATTHYPTGNPASQAASTTTTNTSGMFHDTTAGERELVLVSITCSTGSETGTFKDHAGTTLFVVTATSGVRCAKFGDNGVKLTNGLACTVSGATSEWIVTLRDLRDHAATALSGSKVRGIDE